MHFEVSQFPDVMGFNGGIVNPAVIKVPPGLNKTAPGEKFESKTHVMHDHFYCCQIDESLCPNGILPNDEKTGKKCEEWHKRRIT